jgi:hypothetical protein
MLKKLSLLAMAVAALVAFAVPAAAQASEIITNDEGEEATSITAVSTNVKSTTALGTLECGTVDLKLTGSTGSYHGNGTAVGAGEGSHSGPCKSSSGLTVHIDSITASVNLKGGGSGTAEFTYTYRITSPMGTLSCDFNATGTSVSYAPTSSQISIAGTMTGSGAGCPTTGAIHGTFAVTSGGLPVVIH